MNIESYYQMPKTEKQQNPELSPVIRNVLTFLALLGILFFLWLIIKVKALIILILISIVFATGLAPAVMRLEKTKLLRRFPFARPVAILFIFIGAIIILLSALTLIVIPVIHESSQFSRNLPAYIDAVKTWMVGLQARYPRLPDLTDIINKAQAQIGTVGKYVLASAPRVFGFFGSVVSSITVLVITYYLLASYEGIKRGFLQMIPPQHVVKTERTLGLMAAAMGGWLRGQLILAATIGLVTALFMVIFQVPYPFVIAIIGAIGDLVPMVGVLVAAITAILITLFGPVWKIIAVIVFFITLSAVEGNILSPRIMEKSVGLTPLITIIALIAGASLLGIVGALLAIPIAAALQVLYNEVIAPAIRRSEGGSSKD